MKLLYIEATPSTNDYLKALLKKGILEDFTVLSTPFQTKGRGQRGSEWQSESGKNLIMSLYKQYVTLKVAQQFSIAMAVSLAVQRTLSKYVTGVKVKWPNDVLIHGKKVAGILIETGIKGQKVSWAIIGIGVNLMQAKFKDLPIATSLYLQTQIKITPQDFLKALLPELMQQLSILEKRPYQELQNQYEAQLYGYKAPHTFTDKEGLEFTGTIQGVSQEGALLVSRGNKYPETFKLKEIKMHL